MVEILAGDGIQNAFKALGIEAKRTHKMSHEPYYEIWELDKKGMRVLEEASEWPDEWGWWRYAKGSNMGTACQLFTVNGKELIAWDGSRREDLYNDWELEEEKDQYHYSFKEYEENMMPRQYDTLLEYMCNEIGASLESNVIALAVDLGRANGKTVAQLFQIYQG